MPGLLPAIASPDGRWDAATETFGREPVNLVDASEGSQRVAGRTPGRIVKARHPQPDAMRTASARANGGGSEIRTHDTLAGMVVFKTTALNRSAIPPLPLTYCIKLKKAFPVS